jgi:hypothetical protein
MKTVFALLFAFASLAASAQSDKELVERACMDYIEGFYEGDTTKLIRSLTPSLTKLGFWKNDAGTYENVGYMSYSEAKKYAKNVAEKKEYPKPDAPKKVEVLDVMDQIASAKVTAWWGSDYLLLSKNDDKWMIEEVLWQGPLPK